MSLKVTIAILGVETPKGQALLELLAESDFPYEKVLVVAENADMGDATLLGNKQLPVEDASQFSWEQAQFAFFACDAEIGKKYIPVAADSGCVVFDLSGSHTDAIDVPLVANSVNDYALADFRSSYLVSNPDSAAVHLATLLKPIYETIGVDRVNVTCLQPVSASGKAGIDELAGETATLLNGRPAEPKVYPGQIAFNTLGLVGSAEDNGYSNTEMALVNQVQRLLNDDNLMINPTFIQVPVFYGQALSIHLETREPVSAEWLNELLKQAPHIQVLEENGLPNQVEHGNNSVQISVGRIREDISHGSGINLWSVADDIRFASVGNSLKIARTLLEEYF